MACNTSPLCALKVEVWREAGRTVVDLTGELGISGAVPLRHKLDRFLAEGQVRVLIKMRALTSLDSSGVRLPMDTARETA
jgi:anti-anti-sigma factor